MATTGDAANQAQKRDYCFKHRRMYVGWQCPACADETFREEASVGPSQAARATPAGPHGGGASAPPVAVSRLQSTTRSDEARGLLDAGRAEEAALAAQQAVELDPSNFAAHIVGARAARALGEAPLEYQFLEDAIELLRRPEYSSSPQSYRDLVTCARDITHIRQMARAFAARTWTRAQSLDMLRLLVGRGCNREALLVFDPLSGDRSLETCAYALQLSTRAVTQLDGEVDEFLARVPPDQRGQLLTEFEKLRRDPWFSPATVALLRDGLVRRRKAWEPEIKRQFEDDARQRAEREVEAACSGPALSAAGRLLAIAMALGVVLTAVLGFGLLLFILISLGGVALAAVAYVSVREAELQKRLPEALDGLVEQAARSEREQWDRMLAETVPFSAVEHQEPAEPAQPVERAPERWRMRTCPHCGSLVTEGAEHCADCSHVLPKVEARPSADGEIAAGRVG